MIKRKRSRMLQVCVLCKSRKVRCDKNMPCALCVRHKTAHLCRFEEIGLRAPPASFASFAEQRACAAAAPPQPQQPQPQTQPFAPEFAVRGKLAANPSLEDPQHLYLVPATAALLLLRFTSFASVVAVNPIALPGETINFYLNYLCMSFDPVTLEEMNHGPMSWHSIVRIDPGMLDMWAFMLNTKMVGSQISLVYTKALRPHQDLSLLQVLDRIRKHSLEKFDPTNMRLNAKNIPLGLTFNDPNSKKDVGLPERLLGILPSRRIVWRLIDRFFAVLYPFYPYIDEASFRENVSRMVGPQLYADAPVEKVVFTGGMDGAVAGIFALVLRMSYLSYITNDIKKNTDMMSPEGDPDVREVLLAPIGIEFVDFARLCLNQYQLWNRSSLLVVQLIIFTRIYMEMAPEDPDGPGRDLFLVNNGVLLVMAYSIGLNREPDMLTDIFNDPRQNNVRRKLWLFILSKDILNLMKFGTPLTLAATFFSDTKPPFLDGSNNNCAVPGHDERAMPYFESLNEILPMVRQLVKVILNLKTDLQLSQLVQLLNALELYVQRRFGTLRAFHTAFQKSDPLLVELLIQLPIYVPIQMFIISLYYRLFLHYETRGETALSFFYIKKLFTVLCKESLPFVRDMLEQLHPVFGSAMHLCVNPQLEYLMHRSAGFLSALIIRLGYQITKFDNNGTVAASNRLTLLKYFMRSLSRCFKCCLLGMHKINHRYCYAWRISTTFTYIIRVLVCEGYYQRDVGALKVPVLLYDDDQIRDLAEVVGPVFLKVDLSIFGTLWNKVVEVIKLNGGEEFSTQLFNPLASKVVFHGVPESLTLEEEAVPEQALDLNWFPQMDMDLDSNLTNTMVSFFPGPDAYFDVFHGHDSAMLSGWGVGPF